jgi:hypothetical protein
MRVRGRFPLVTAGACLLALAAPAWVQADTVTLDNGKILEGHVIDNGDSITIEMSQGSVTLAKSRVKSISVKVTPQDEFRRRYAEIQTELEGHKQERADAAERFLALSQWAGEQGLPRGREEALRRALDLDPDNAAAREAGGYVPYNGRWVTKAERNQLLGFVLHEGQWVTPEAAQEAHQAKEAVQQKKRQADRAEPPRRPKPAETDWDETERDQPYPGTRPRWMPWRWYDSAGNAPIYWPPTQYPYWGPLPYVLVPSGDPTLGRPASNAPNIPNAGKNSPGPYGPQLRAFHSPRRTRGPQRGLEPQMNADERR